MKTTLSFILSMPGRNSWNGKWSGESNLHAIVTKVKSDQADKLLAVGYWSYNFGDGWRAGVECRTVTPAEARKFRKHSCGFCGYDWMVTSILCDGAIYGPTQPKPALQEEV